MKVAFFGILAVLLLAAGALTYRRAHPPPTVPCTQGMTLAPGQSCTFELRLPAGFRAADRGTTEARTPMTDKHDPPNTLRIDAVWMFISVDDEDNEEVCAYRIGDMFVPLVAADETRLEAMRPLAAEIARNTKKAVRLIRLDRRTELEVIG